MSRAARKASDNPEADRLRRLLKCGFPVVAIEPWSAAGPGWANRGVYVRVRRTDTQAEERLCLYERDLGVQGMTLFSVALLAYSALMGAIEREGRGDA